MSLTWGEAVDAGEPDPELEALAALDRLNDRFEVVIGGVEE